MVGGGQGCKENYFSLGIPLKLSKSVCMTTQNNGKIFLKKKAYLLRSTPIFHNSQAISPRFQIP